MNAAATFQCPSCLKGLQYEKGETPFMTCRHCKGKIIVPSTVVHQVEIEAGKPTDFALREQKDLKLAEIRRELNTGQKIQAIKTFRETFGADLKTAKDAVERLEKNRKVEIPKSALRENFVNSAQENPAEHRLYQDFKKQSAGHPSPRGGAMLFWLIVGIAIALYVFFSGN